MAANRVPFGSSGVREFSAATVYELVETLRSTSNKDAAVIAFELPQELAPQQQEAITDTVRRVVKLSTDRAMSRDQATLEALVDAWIRLPEPSEFIQREAAMIADARSAVLESAEWLTAAQIAELAGFSESNVNAQPSRWKRERRIFAIKPPAKVELFPAYGLDQKSGFRPLPAMREVLSAFGRHREAWGIAEWFASVNSFLGNKRPQDLLRDEPDAVIAAARDEVAGVTHG